MAKLVGEMGRPDKVMTIVYAVGLTHHTTGVAADPLRRAAAAACSGNMGRPGGGMNAERGHANIQGNTDHAISWDILPGYLRMPAPGQSNVDDYVAQSASKKLRPNSLNFFGDELPQVHGQPAQDLVRRRGHEEQRVRVRLHAQAGGQRVVAVHLRPGAARARWKA